MNLPTLVLLIGGGILVLSILKDNKEKISQLLSSFTAKVKTSVDNSTDPVVLDSKNVVIDLVKTWVDLKAKAKAAGNDLAVKQLDTLFPSLNKDIKTN